MPENSTVTIAQAEYAELVRGKTIADALTALIHNKRETYSSLTLDEIKLLDVMYCIQNGES